jgi:murein DD-endopeptidase MepM/ murein hydrolase activator NlpD
LNLAQQGYTAKKIVTTIVNQENKSLHQAMDTVTRGAYITKPFIYPLANIKVVGNFGDIRASKPYKIQHLGVDLRASTGTPVHAANDGKIVFEKTLPDYGNMIILDHGQGIYSLYLHLSKFNVADGQMVKQHDVIAYSGASGYAIGPHLHFSIKIRGGCELKYFFLIHGIIKTRTPPLSLRLRHENG